MSVKMFKMVVVAVSGLVAFSAMAHPPEGEQHPVRWMARQLDLTLAQKQDLRTLMQRSRQDAGVYMEDLEAMRRELHDLVIADTFDTQMVAEIMARYKPVMLSMAQQRDLHMQQMLNLLSAEQRQKLANLHQQQGQRGQLPQRRQQRMLARLLEKLAITEDQTSLIQALKDTVEKRGQVQRVKKSFMQSLRAARAQDSIDDSGFNGLFEDFYEKLVDTATLAVAAARELMPMLTDEQRRVLQELKQRGRHPG